MRIKTAIVGAVAASLIAVLLVAILAISYTQELRNLDVANKRIQKANKAVSHLQILAHEFALYGELRASEQWHSQFETVLNTIQLKTSIDDSMMVPEAINAAYILQESFILLEHERWSDSTSFVTKRNLLLDRLFLNNQFLADVIEQWANTVSLRRELAEVNLEILTISAPGVIFIMLLMLAKLLSNRVLKPLANFHQTVQSIATGNLNARCATSAKDEFGDLTRAFDKMAIDLVQELKNKIHEKELAEVKLRQAAAVFSNSQEGIMITDASSKIIDVNPAFELITGYSKAEVVGKNPSLLSSGRHPPEFYDVMWKSLNETGTWQGEVWNRHKSGSTYVELVSIDKVDDQPLEKNFYVAVFSDITRIKNHEKELHRIAHYDQLTGLPNRRLLNDRLDQSLAHAERAHTPLAVCFLDLDGFKTINDNHGHSTGDKVLVHLTHALQQALRKGDTIARLGGDEFVILLSELKNTEEINTALHRILSLINKPITIEGLTLSISASIGATIFPADNVDSESLLRHADQAMYAAKEAGKNRYSIFDPQHAHDMQEHHTYQQRLSAALMNEEFVLYYQPKVNLVSGEVVGVEALIRWQHPDEGLLPPNKFLHYIEGSPLEVPVSEWVLQSVFKEATSGILSQQLVSISINISAHHLQSESFIPYLKFLFEEYPSIKQRVIEFEILETQAFTDFEAAINIIHECKAMGIRFALDDFGTGYSSLTYLQRLPFDILKIDQSFVINMLNDSNDLGIIDSVVRLAKAFNREVIAEGVETMEHAKILIDYQCYQGQGYGIGYPMPASDFPAWLAHWNTQALWEKLTQNRFE